MVDRKTLLHSGYFAGKTVHVLGWGETEADSVALGTRQWGWRAVRLSGNELHPD
jgi:hypothetical protein